MRSNRDLLAEATAAKADVDVWAWCLMPNHVHLILVPSDAERGCAGRWPARTAATPALFMRGRPAHRAFSGRADSARVAMDEGITLRPAFALRVAQSGTAPRMVARCTGLALGGARGAPSHRQGRRGITAARAPFANASRAFAELIAARDRDADAIRAPARQPEDHRPPAGRRSISGLDRALHQAPPQAAQAAGRNRRPQADAKMTTRQLDALSP